VGRGPRVFGWRDRRLDMGAIDLVQLVPALC
jgi:hypothetical protein